MQTQTITREQVVDLVLTLPLDRLKSVYDFALFLKQQQQVQGGTVDIFGETEDEIRIDNERWDEQFAEAREQMRAMAREAAAEFRAGRTKPMEFTAEGRLVR